MRSRWASPSRQSALIPKMTRFYNPANTKYPDRDLAEFQYRFNRRFNMKTILARLLHALVAAPAAAERCLRLAEVSR